MAVERREAHEVHKRADDEPLDEMRRALASAQDDLQAKAEEAAALGSKVARLEGALRQLGV